MLSTAEKEAYAYAELLEVLSSFDDNDINKIPPGLMQVFQTNALPTYQKHLNLELDLDKLDLQDETIELLTILTLNYWCESEEDKKEIESLLRENNRKEEKEINEKYNPNNIFSNNTISHKTEQSTTNITNSTYTDYNYDEQLFTNNISSNLPVDTSTYSIFKKIQIKIIDFIKKYLKINKFKV